MEYEVERSNKEAVQERLNAYAQRLSKVVSEQKEKEGEKK